MSRLIDADELIRKIQEKEGEPDYQHEGESWSVGLIMAEEIVNSTPTVDAEPVRHGHWVTQWNRYDKDGYVIQTIGRCSCCNQYSDVLDYCGNCGAKMDGEE